MWTIMKMKMGRVVDIYVYTNWKYFCRIRYQQKMAPK